MLLLLILLSCAVPRVDYVTRSVSRHLGRQQLPRLDRSGDLHFCSLLVPSIQSALRYPVDRSLRAYLRRRIANAAALLAAARPTSIIWSSWTRRLTIAHRTLVSAASSPSRFRFEFEAIWVRVRVFVLERRCAFIMRRCKCYVLLTGCRASTTAFSTRATS